MSRRPWIIQACSVRSCSAPAQLEAHLPHRMAQPDRPHGRPGRAPQQDGPGCILLVARPWLRRRPHQRSVASLLRAALSGAYAGCLTNRTCAAMELHLVMSVSGARAREVTITGDRFNERRRLGVGPWVAGRLLLFDFGYFWR